jgi:hypothetical protein
MANLLSTWMRRYGRAKWIIRIAMMVIGWLVSRRGGRGGTLGNIIQGQSRPRNYTR